MWLEAGTTARVALPAVAIDCVGTGLVLPFYVVYFRDVRHVPVTHIGILVALPFALSALASGPVGSLVDRVGVRAVLVMSMLTLAGTQVLMSRASTEAVIATALALLGLGFVGQGVALMTFLGNVLPSSLRQRFFGLRFAIMNLGMACGGALSGLFVSLDRPSTFSLVFVGDSVSYLIALAIFVVAMGLHRPPVLPTTSTVDGVPPIRGYGVVLRDPVTVPLVGLAFVIGVVGYTQMNVGFPAFARSVGATPRTLGIAFAANGVVIVLAQLAVVSRLSGVRRTRALTVVAALWFVVWALVGLTQLVNSTTAIAVMLVGSSAIFALGETFLQPTLPAVTNDVATDEVRGRYNALVAGAEQASFVLGSVVAGLMIGEGARTAYVVLLCTGCLGAAVLSARVLERRLDPIANGLQPGPVVMPVDPSPEAGPP
jgi:MFS family permease